MRRRVAAGGKKKGRKLFRRKETGRDSSTDGATDLQHEDTLSEYEESQDELEEEEEEEGEEEGENEDEEDQDEGDDDEDDEDEEMEDVEEVGEEEEEEESEKQESELDVYEGSQSDSQRLSSKRLRRSERVMIEEPPSKRGRWSKGFSNRWSASNKGPF